MPIDWGALKSTEEPEETNWDEVEKPSNPQPFSDPGLEDEEDTGPSFLGKRWREITDPQEAREAWCWLREWVDWFVVEYRVPVDKVPPCWFQHREIVAELWAAANAEYKVWEEGAATTMPLTAWHSYLPGLLDRLGNNSAQACVADKEHRPENNFGSNTDPRALSVNEAQWAAHLESVVDTENEVGGGRWRMSVADAEGNVVSSEAVSVAREPIRPTLHVEQPVLSYTGAGAPALTGRAVGVGLRRTWWEQEVEGEWMTRLTSMRDVSVTTDETDGE